VFTHLNKESAATTHENDAEVQFAKLGLPISELAELTKSAVLFFLRALLAVARKEIATPERIGFFSHSKQESCSPP